MLLDYATNALRRNCTDDRRMRAAYGADVAKKLRLRLAEVEYFREMADLLGGTGHWEELKGDRAGQWSARLTKNWRLVVEPEVRDVLTVIVVEIVDYHKA